MRFLLAIFALTISAVATPSQRIGQPLVITDVYIPGGEAKPAPRRDREPPLVVRLLEVKPAKDGFRYDFEVQGLEAGTHDLAKFLVPVDPATPPNFQEIPVEITSKLPPGIALPEIKPEQNLPALGGYRTKMITAAAVWLAGLVAILFWKKKSKITPTTEVAAPSLAERIHPLLAEASAGRLDATGRATLERLILGHWRERLPDIADLSPTEAMVKLRHHPEASPLVLALERWLHSRDAQTSPAEIERLLAPYR